MKEYDDAVNATLAAARTKSDFKPTTNHTLTLAKHRTLDALAVLSTSENEQLQKIGRDS